MGGDCCFYSIYFLALQCEYMASSMLVTWCLPPPPFNCLRVQSNLTFQICNWIFTHQRYLRLGCGHVLVKFRLQIISVSLITIILRIVSLSVYQTLSACHICQHFSPQVIVLPRQTRCTAFHPFQMKLGITGNSFMPFS